MEQIRSFIAIELPADLRSKLGELIAHLKSEGQSGVKWVNASGIHLTLIFLGDIVSGQTDEITRAIEESTQGIPPFQLEIKGLGVFPNLRRPQVAWVGVEGELDKLGKLHQNLEFNLELLGFTPESRTFSPHLTLARMRNEASFEERQKLGQIITSTKFEGGSFKVDTVSLMRSQLTREGAIYSRVSLARLK